VASRDFAKAIAPVKLTPTTFNAGPSLIEALFAGELDIGYIGPGPVINAHVRSRGQGVRVIAGVSANGVVIVARGDSDIRTLADLKGRKLATPQLGNTQDISARNYLLKTLGQPNLDNVLAIANAEQIGLMARGQIDAAWVPEPWGARLVEEAGGRIVAEEKDLWPGKEFTLAVMVTSPEFLAAHPEIIKKILAEHQKWVRRLAGESDRYAADLNRAMTKETGKPMSEAIIRAALSRTRFTDQPLEQTFRTFAEWSANVGNAAQAPDMSHLIDTTLLNSLRRQ